MSIWSRVAACVLAGGGLAVAVVGATASPSMGAGGGNRTRTFVNAANGVCRSFQPSYQALKAKEQSAESDTNTLTGLIAVLGTSATVLQQIATKLATVNPPSGAKVQYDRGIDSVRYLASKIQALDQTLRKVAHTVPAATRAFTQFGSSINKTSRAIRTDFRGLGLKACTYASD